VAATASSGNAGDVIDGKNDSGFHSIWQPTGALPQSVTVDLGQVRADVGWVGVVPYASGDVSTTQGNITSYAVSVSSDGSKFTEMSSGTWAADGKMKVVTFAPTAARYVKLEARAAANGTAAITEITVGGRP
jgi:alpha-L-fucosidase